MADCQWPSGKPHPAFARVSYSDGYVIDLCQPMLDSWLDQADDRGRASEPTSIEYL